jgi:formylglycine-generating enzyme required for sulfatase activity
MYPGRTGIALAAACVIGAFAALCASGCRLKDGKGGTEDAAATNANVPSLSADPAALMARTAATASGSAGTSLERPPPARPGMAWISAGTLRAGTPPDRVPRIAEEELPGTALPMNGFYIDLLPYPNEASAIPTSNVTREDAANLCAAKGKRLCTEFEWERACKGPANSTYEYGDAYRAATCGTGAPAAHTARHPSGERALCKSGFGVQDLHGAMWEWTDSAWTRGTAPPSAGLFVLRGGNAEAGELVGRCANALARKPTLKNPTVGFRCCAGPKNAPPANFEQKKGLVFERVPNTAEIAAALVPEGTKTWGSDGAGAFVPSYAWIWRPTANEELRVVSGCAHPPEAPNAKGARCGVLVGRLIEIDVAGERDAGASDAAAPLVNAKGAALEMQLLTKIDSGHQLSEVVLFGSSKLTRMWGIDAKGAFVREISYGFGRVTLGEPKRH